jgi:hypothetical protein
MMNKRGDEESITQEIIYLLLLIGLVMGVFAFVYTKSNGDAMKEQNLAKQLALLIDSARPGTTLYVNFEKVMKVEILDSSKEVFVQASEVSKGTKYPYFNADDVSWSVNNKLLIIDVVA